MAVPIDLADSADVLTDWLAAPKMRVRSGRRVEPGPGRLRFAFYGRTSTIGFQDRVSSRRWQFESATDLIAGHGAIVAEYFDMGYSRRLPWTSRPQAAALLAAVADPHRGFDAIVVGEYERAFHGDQLLHLAALFEEHGVQLWLPEVHGPVNRHNPAHQALVMLLGAQSRREVLRSRFRTTAAMRVQAREQGRYLGGRPPYGFRLVDAGPHPNAVHARWGRRLRRLEPDPATAPTVRWIFGERLAGRSVAGIARALNEEGVPPPSIMDSQRNLHRTVDGWSVRTVAAILANPRYTGRQVWNRQRTDHDQPHDRARSGRGRVTRWNSPDQWVISKTMAHPALVSEQDFVTAQRVSAVPEPTNGSGRRYLLVGLLRCGHCRRRLHSHWAHGRASYRCRHGRTSANLRSSRAKSLYLREDLAFERIKAIFANDVNFPTGPADIAEHLRRTGVSITCTPRSCSIDMPNRHADADTVIVTRLIDLRAV